MDSNSTVSNSSAFKLGTGFLPGSNWLHHRRSIPKPVLQAHFGPASSLLALDIDGHESSNYVKRNGFSQVDSLFLAANGRRKEIPLEDWLTGSGASSHKLSGVPLARQYDACIVLSVGRLDSYSALYQVLHLVQMRLKRGGKLLIELELQRKEKAFLDILEMGTSQHYTADMIYEQVHRRVPQLFTEFTLLWHNLAWIGSDKSATMTAEYSAILIF